MAELEAVQPAPADVQAAPAARKAKARRAPTVPTAPRARNNALLGVAAVLALLAGALAWSVAQSLDQTIEVLAAANPIVEGQKLSRDDFKTVEIAAAEGDIQAIDPNQMDRLIGLIAAGPIGEGTLLHPLQLVLATDIDSVVVGAALGPNHYPTRGLIDGDVVRLIEVSDSIRSSSDDSFRTGTELAVGEVVGVTQLASQDVIQVSIRISESVASVVADRIAQDRLTLALVDDRLDLTDVTPLEQAEPVVPAELLAPGAGQ